MIKLKKINCWRILFNNKENIKQKHNNLIASKIETNWSSISNK